MRLTFRISLLLLAFAITWFCGFGWYLLTVESNDLRASAQEETILLAHGLQVAIENALRDRQVEDVNETISKLHSVEPGIFVGLFDAKSKPSHLSDAVASFAYRPIVDRVLNATRVTSRTEFEPDGLKNQLVVAQPLYSDSSELLGILVIGRPLDRLNRDLQTTRQNIVYSIVATVLGLLVITLGSGILLIGRPLARLVAWMRRIRETGSLSVSATPVSRWNKARNEVSELEDEFASMLSTLRSTQARLDEQLELREQLERQVRHVDKLATVGQLAAGLAHEIGSPLQILNGRARILLQNADTDEVKRQARILVEQSERISRIVAQLLSYARRQMPNIQSHDVVPLIKNVLELLEHEMKRRKVVVNLIAPQTSRQNATHQV